MATSISSVLAFLQLLGKLSVLQDVWNDAYSVALVEYWSFHPFALRQFSDPIYLCSGYVCGSPCQYLFTMMHKVFAVITCMYQHANYERWVYMNHTDRIFPTMTHNVYRYDRTILTCITLNEWAVLFIITDATDGIIWTMIHSICWMLLWRIIYIDWIRHNIVSMQRLIQYLTLMKRLHYVIQRMYDVNII